MIIKATFTGKNSLGYEHGKMYDLKLDKNKPYICIERLDGTGRCPYMTKIAFDNNWSNIKIIEE